MNGKVSIDGKSKIEMSFTPNVRTERHEATDRAGGQAALFG